LAEQLQARDSELEAAAEQLKQAEEKMLALKEAKDELSAAAEKANETVSARLLMYRNIASLTYYFCLRGRHHKRWRRRRSLDRT
jgi:hypothetical protein